MAAAVAPADAAGPRLSTTGVDVRVPGRRLVDGLAIEAAGGQFVAVLGANGAGKSMTLRTLALQRPPDGGAVRVDGRAREAWGRRELACRLGMLPQAHEDPFPTTVLEAALIGRHPHLGFWEWEGAMDRELARSALARVDLTGLEDRHLDSLSGGERRRVAIAALLLQDPRIAILDEPTNHLDPRHQLQVLDLFAARVADGDLVLASLHDATLAARYADRVLLLYGDGGWSFGDTASTLTPANLARLYGAPVGELAFGARRVFVVG
jgi:iron complex transport system ATP-binding protein